MSKFVAYEDTIIIVIYFKKAIMEPFWDAHSWHKLLIAKRNMLHSILRGEKSGRISHSYSKSGVNHILFRGENQQNIFEEKADYDKL